MKKLRLNRTTFTHAAVIIFGAATALLLVANLGSFLLHTEARAELALYGIVPTLFVYIPLLTVLVVSLFTLSMIRDGKRRGYRGVEFAVGVIAISAFVLGYQQWLDGRREVSLDKYYERLDGADQRLSSWPAAQKMLRHFWNDGIDQESFQRYNYVYVELDNLEYILEKYKLGYVDARHASRAIATFASRCQSTEFRELLATIIGIDAGYQKTTISVAKKMCNCKIAR